ncbi:ABC transporter permease [Lysobacter sp. F60174L2]|uniref:ABC transporter permease n=1 Tax=Lysobacter sp. F60174L2 TaxID=3459295 RepID=UPI00403DB06C
MSALMRTLSAESLKLRGTLALWMCLIAPATVVGLTVLQVAFADLGDKIPPPPAEAWHRLALGMMTLWAFLMLPLFVTLEAALLAGLEHANHRWRHLLALPLPRSNHYLGKVIALLVLVALALVALLLLIPLGGWVLAWLQPKLGIAGPPPWAFIAGRLGACLVASMLVVALQTWIALRWRSFTVAVASGMVATVGGFLIGQSARFGHWYPWSAPSQVLAGGGVHTDHVMLLGLLGGFVVTLLMLWDLLRRDID